MAVKRRGGLGKGLDSLIPSLENEPEQVVEPVVQKPALKKAPAKSASAKKEPAKKAPAKKAPAKKTPEPKPQIIVDNQPKFVDIYEVEPDRDQPRKEFDADGLEELAQSIRQYGILQPILVNNSEGYYKIIAGERRWRAAKLAGLEKVPILVKELTEEKAFEISLIENIQRQDLNPIEEALAYRRLMDEYHMTQETVAERVGKSRPAVANFLRLLQMEPEVQQWVQDGSLSLGHAKVLSGVSAGQTELAKKAIEEGWSVRQLENAVKALGRVRRQTEPMVIPQYQEVEKKIRDILGTKVNIQFGKRKGKIEIEYYSEEDLERLMMLFGSIRANEN